MKEKDLVRRAKRVLSPALTHATDIEVVRGKGVYLYDKEGREYLDFASGIAVTAAGHCHPKVVAAAERQTESLIHACAGIVYYEQNIALAEKLKEITPEGLDMTFFGHSGSEAVEAALKLAKYVSGKKNVVAFQGSFHGRTLGALSVTFSKEKYREGYEPLVPGVYLAPYAYCYRCPKKRTSFKPKTDDSDFPDPDCCAMECLKELELVIKKVKDSGIAAMIIEPVQGEGGYIVPPKEFIQGVRELCDKNGIFLIFDEVQSGFGRTGKMFASEHFGVTPDIMALAKAIASGFPLSAAIGKEEIMKKWSPGAHGGTMSGNPVTCAASLATIDAIESEEMIKNAEKVGRHIKGVLLELKKEYDCVGDVRGLGLMLGVEFVKPNSKDPNPEIVKTILAECLKEGLIMISCGSDGQVIRIVPALNVTKDQADQALDILKRAINTASRPK